MSITKASANCSGTCYLDICCSVAFNSQLLCSLAALSLPADEVQVFTAILMNAQKTSPSLPTRGSQQSLAHLDLHPRLVVAFS
jgi:hypothetical protein